MQFLNQLIIMEEEEERGLVQQQIQQQQKRKKSKFKKEICLLVLVAILLLWFGQIDKSSDHHHLSIDESQMRELPRQSNSHPSSIDAKNQSAIQQVKEEITKQQNGQIEAKEVLPKNQQNNQIDGVEYVAKSSDLLPKRPHSEMVKILQSEHFVDNVSGDWKMEEIPLCIVSYNVSSKTLQKIKGSIQRTSYQNYQHVYEQASQSASIPKFSKLIREKCLGDNPVVVMGGSLLKKQSLQKINKIYQEKFVWITSHPRDGKKVNSITSFYLKLFEQLSDDYLQKWTGDSTKQMHVLGKGLMKLGLYRGQKLRWEDVFVVEPEREGLEYFIGRIDPFLQAEPIAPSMSLWPYPFISRYTARNYESFIIKERQKDNKQQENKYHKPRNNLTIQNLERAIQYLELKSLPKEHSLANRQRNYYEQKYSISNAVEQYPLCIIVPSFNNIEGQRYQKVIKSINQQSYSNYVIVFVDDGSTDQTLRRTKQYAQSLGINDQKIIYVHNQERMYATFNIYTSVKDQCRGFEREIVVLIDGDDELIGRYVFQLINSAYHHRLTTLAQKIESTDQNWVVYFSFMSSDFGYGVSKDPFFAKFDQQSPREKYHVFGALRTFYAKLFLKIREEDHKDSEGNFLKTVYDDALQYPLFQMAGPTHVQYIPQIVYFYNRFYGGNDDSDKYKQQMRAQQHQQLLKREKYKRISSLFD